MDFSTLLNPLPAKTLLISTLLNPQPRYSIRIPSLEDMYPSSIFEQQLDHSDPAVARNLRQFQRPRDDWMNPPPRQKFPGPQCKSLLTFRFHVGSGFKSNTERQCLKSSLTMSLSRND
jgi:hypothetical protein